MNQDTTKKPSNRGTQKKTGSTWYELTKHPLTSIIVGFLLTGLLGTAITHHYESLAENKRQLEIKRKSTEDLMKTAATLIVSAEKLVNLMEVKAPTQEIQEAEKKYYKILEAWKIASLLIPFYSTQSGVYYPSRKYISESATTINEFLNSVNICLINMLSEYKAGTLRSIETPCPAFGSRIWNERAHSIQDRINSASQCLYSAQVVIAAYVELDTSKVYNLQNSMICIQKGEPGQPHDVLFDEYSPPLIERIIKFFNKDYNDHY